MHIFTQSTAFLTTDDHRPSVVSFLTCLRYIFNSSVIPEILSNDDPELFKKLVTECKQVTSWYRLFVRSDTMQFSPTLITPVNYQNHSCFHSDGFVDDILRPLKKNMRYFSCTLQRCEVIDRDLREDREGILALLADVRSLTHLDLRCHININKILSLFLASSCRNQLEHLSLGLAQDNDDDECLDDEIEGYFQHVRFLELYNTHSEVSPKLIKRCPNLRTLIISSSSWVSLDKIVEFVPKLTTLVVNHVNDEVSRLSTLCDKLPELTSLDLVASCRRDSQLRNIDFLRDKPLMHEKLRELNVELSREEWYEPSKNNDCVKDCLSHFRNLSRLDLRNFGGQLNDENFGHLVYLINLQQVRIFGAEVTSKGLFELALLAGAGKNQNTFFTNLEAFGMVGCFLGGTTESPQHLLKFFSCCATNKLEVLQLDDVDLSDADLTPDLVAEWKRCGVKRLLLNGNTDLSYNNDDDDNREKKNDKNGLVNLSQLTSITSLHISQLVNVQGLNFLANMQELRELDASNLPILKSSAMKVFSPHHNARNSFLYLRDINLDGSCCESADAELEVIELLRENENIKLRLEELRLSSMSAKDSLDAFKKDPPISFHPGWGFRRGWGGAVEGNKNNNESNQQTSSSPWTTTSTTGGGWGNNTNNSNNGGGGGWGNKKKKKKSDKNKADAQAKTSNSLAFSNVAGGWCSGGGWVAVATIKPALSRIRILFHPLAISLGV